MRSLRWIWFPLALALLWAAAPSSWAQKKTTRSSKAAPQKSGKKAAAPKRPAAKSKSSRARRTTAKRRTRATSARRTYRASQQKPTPERYAAIQKALAGKGYFDGAVDGSWRDSSVEALKRFQQDQNLKADGKLNSLSLIALGLGPSRTSYVSEPPPASPSPATSPDLPPRPVEPEPATLPAVQSPPPR